MLNNILNRVSYKSEVAKLQARDSCGSRTRIPRYELTYRDIHIDIFIFMESYSKTFLLKNI